MDHVVIVRSQHSIVLMRGCYGTENARAIVRYLENHVNLPPEAELAFEIQKLEPVDSISDLAREISDALKT